MKKHILTTLVFVNFYSANAIANSDETTKQVTRQVTRQISNSIARRIGESSQGDGTSGSEFNAWGNPQYTDLSSRNSNTSLYSLTFGGDKKINNNIILGGSLSYNRSETETRNAGFSSNSDSDGGNAWSVAPYLAYKFNDHAFFSGILGYAGSSQDNSSFSTSTFLSDVSLNGLTEISGIGLTGKIGYRAIHTDLSGGLESVTFNAGGSTISTPRIPDSSFAQTAYLGGEVSKQIGDVRPYFASTWEHIAPDQNIKDTDLVFTTLGLDYSVKKSTTVGIYYTRELLRGDDSQNHLIYNAAGANVKIKF